MKKYIFFLLLISFKVFSQGQSGFVNQLISTNINVPTGLTFDANGRMYVWEKAGRVYIFNGSTRVSTPLVDIREEVLDFLDHGLNGFALDPNFLSNGYIYLYYVADRNYLDNFGQSGYSTSNNDKFTKATIARIVRYTANSANGFTTLVANSRLVLVGNTLSDGIPIVMDNHGVGSLAFASDGSLLFSCGDVALPGNDENQSFWVQAEADGILTPETRVSMYRAQVINSLNGKIGRINPLNGEGYASNPWYDVNFPKAPRSRVWARGLRNPFRFSIKPGTGSTNPTDGNVGTLFIGDVGWTKREEINVADSGGMNFGWPILEGDLPTVWNDPTYTPSSPTLPAVVWRGGLSARAYQSGEFYDAGTTEFQGQNFTGNSAIGGIWYTGTAYPAAYQNSYFAGDYTPGWIKSFNFSSNNEATKVSHFFDTKAPTCFAYNPTNQSIYFTAYEYPSTHEIRRILYDPSYNNPPIAVIQKDKGNGNAPLTVQFNGASSFDPENSNLYYSWNFGDGGTSNSINPSHTFLGSTSYNYTVTLTVYDVQGKTGVATTVVNINNSVPEISNFSINPFDSLPPTGRYKLLLSATVNDQNEYSKLLTYNWQIALHHEDHVHSLSNSFADHTKFGLEPIPCDGQTYFYRISLGITDEWGISTTNYKDIYPKCLIEETNAPADFGLKTTEVKETSMMLDWEPVYDDSGIWGYEIIVNNEALGVIPPNITEYRLTNCVFDTPYDIQIKAIDLNGNYTLSGKLRVKTKPPCASGSTYLSDLNWTSASSNTNKVTKDAYLLGNINLSETAYEKGLSVSSGVQLYYNLASTFKKFTADIGREYAFQYPSCGAVRFKVKKNGADIFTTNGFKRSGFESINLDISNTNELRLVVEDASVNTFCNTHSAWANAFLSTCTNYDNISPTLVENISTQLVSENTFDIKWNTANDNNAITYTVFLDDDSLTSTTDDSVRLSSLTYGIKKINILATDQNAQASVSASVLVNFVNPCPPSTALTGTLVDNLTTYRAAEYINTIQKIEGNSNIYLKAGKSVLMEPGFEIKPPAIFYVEIKNCNE